MLRFWIALWLLAFVATSALAAETPQTVSDYNVALDDVARRLDLQLGDRQRAGAAAAAQRLALAAAMVRRVSAEFRDAEQNDLTNVVDSLPAPVKAASVAAFARAGEAETRAADDPRFIDEALATFNALIRALPIRTPHPIVYGLLSNDLTDPGAGLPADVVIYGYRLVDPVDAAPPSVAYAGVDLPSAAVHVSADRLEVTLPAATKAAMKFAPPPCSQRPSFGLRVHSIYALAHGFWPIVWHTQVDTSADAFALASPVLFVARISGVANADGAEASTVPFRRLSDFVVAECLQTKSVEVTFATPEGASDVTCQAAWVSATGGTATSGTCQNQNGTVSASGALTGGAKICSPDKLCTCPTNAQGFLQITGSYRLSQSASGYKPVADVAPLVFPRGGLAEATIGDERLRHLKIEIARRDCPKVADTMSLELGDNAGASGVAVSSSAAFRAVFDDHQLRVGSTEAFAP